MMPETEPEFLTVPCCDCRAPVQIAPQIARMSISFSKLLEARGERGLAETEVACCRTCFMRRRAEGERRAYDEYIEASRIIDDLRSNDSARVVSQERMQAALAGGHGDMVREVLRAASKVVGSDRAEAAPAAPRGQRHWSDR